MACDLNVDAKAIGGEAVRWLPTDTWVRLLIVPTLTFIALATDRGYLADFWHHLARGRAMVETGALVDADLFTFTVPGREFQDVNWLTQVVYFRLFEVGGLDLVQIVNALVTAVTLGWLVCLCRRLCGSWSVAAGVGAATFFGLWQVLTIRPQTFSLLLFVILLDILRRSREKSWLLVIAPFILGLWANLHGAFPAGLMLLGCFALSSAWDELQTHRTRGRNLGSALRQLFFSPKLWVWAGVIALSVVATLVNPYGWRIYQYVGLTSNVAATRRIDEWLPPSWDQWIGVAWFVSLFVLGGLIAAQRLRLGKWIAVRDVILLLCFGFLASRSIRMVAWWLVILAPVAATMVSRLVTLSRERQEPSWGAGIFVGCLGIFVLSSLPNARHLNPLLASRTQPRTEEALDEVHAHLKTIPTNGRVFCRLEWSEYLTWAFHPQHKVFMDGRIEIYPDTTWKEYADVTTGQAMWTEILKRHEVDVLVLDSAYHARTGLLPCVEASGEWQRVIETGPAVLYVRRSS